MDYYFSENNKTRLHWTLSDYAEDIINMDIRNLNLQRLGQRPVKFSRFVNMIFTNYAEDAQSSVIGRLKKNKMNESLPDDIFDEFCRIMHSIIKEKYLAGKGKLQTARIHIANIQYMKESNELGLTDDQSENPKQYDRPGKYFRAVLEEYASLSVAQREKIIYKELFNKIETACDNKELAEITVNAYNGLECHYVYPVTYPKLSNDGSAYYAVGIEKCSVSSSVSFKPYSVRVSQIESVKTEIRNMNSLSEQQKKEFVNAQKLMERELEFADVSFLRFPVVDIVVRFTKNGERTLNNITHNRPNMETKEYLEDGKDSYHCMCLFKCTAEQLMYYLHAFGEDAVVVSPPEVADKMKEFYFNAAEAYRNNND